MKTATISSEELSKIPLFAGMNATECRQLAEIASVVSFTPGDLVLLQGESSQNLWVVLEGQAEVFKAAPMAGRETEDGLVLAQLAPHQVFGEMSFFHQAPHSASVRAKTPLKLLRIARGDFEDLIQDGAWGAYKLAFNAVATMAERLRHMTDWVAELQAAAQAGTPVSPQENPPVSPDGVAPNAITNNRRFSEWSAFRDKLFDGWNL